MKPKLLSQETWDELVGYLLGYEDDIAWSIEGFGSLENIFREVIGREPQKAK